MLEPLLTPLEVATWLRMSRVWVYKQAEKGLLPYRRVGEAIRFDPEEIRNYLQSRKCLKRTYPKPRNLKGKKHSVFLANQQEATKNNLNVGSL
jgi:excisionase family DNA binding protein